MDLEATKHFLNEAHTQIEALKRKKQEHKGKIRELRNELRIKNETIAHKNHMLQNAQLHMWDLENQLEEMAAQQHVPAAPEPEGEDDPEEIQGESGIESGPE